MAGPASCINGERLNCHPQSGQQWALMTFQAMFAEKGRVSIENLAGPTARNNEQLRLRVIWPPGMSTILE